MVVEQGGENRRSDFYPFNNPPGTGSEDHRSHYQAISPDRSPDDIYDSQYITQRPLLTPVNDTSIAGDQGE